MERVDLPDDRDALRRLEVVVFGAGIAGLTAAHELIERGFRVEVYEKAEPSVIDELNGVPCAIGGMARTQWSRIDRPDTTQHAARTMKRVEPIRTETRRELAKKRIEFKHGLGEDLQLDEAARKVIREVAQIVAGDETIRRIEIRGYTRDRNARPYTGDWEVRPDCLGARKVEDELNEQFAELLREPRTCSLYAAPLGFPGDGLPPETCLDFVAFRVIEDFVPGEHGFRFFPSYYRHLSDTMRRTPISGDDGAFRETGRTVLDNLLRTQVQRISHEDHSRSFDFRRRPPQSLDEQFNYLSGMMRSMGATLSDLDRLQKCLLRYMTSCPDRRAAEGENRSWFDYVHGEQFSPDFQDHMDTTGQMLVSMTARQADARSFGTSNVQLLLDQMYDQPRTDGTLSGPTSVAWFEHWRRYLERQGVEFHRGELKHFVVGDDDTIWPIVDVPPQPMATPGAASRQPDTPGLRAVVRDYYVVALDVVGARDVLDQPESRPLVGDDFDKIRRLDLGDWHRAQPTGALRHMSGLQFYFECDIPFVEGHTDYADSAWALSSISQPQFWTQRRGWWSGYRGVLSVDICNFSAQGSNGKCAWECTPDELAAEVWKQIEATLPKDKGQVYAAPIFYHIDDNLVFDEKRGGVRENRSPYLINRVGEYGSRPGCPDDYRVGRGNIVFAGTFMQTHTRMTTMEAANESARHAVNAILRHSRFQGHRCEIFNPEENEVADLKYLVELDQRLFDDGLPHFMEALGSQIAPRDLLRRPASGAALLRQAGPAERPLLRKPRGGRR